MPIEYNYDKKNNFLYEIGSGDISLDDFIAFRKELKTVNLRADFKCLANYLDARVMFRFDEMWNVGHETINIAKDHGNVKLAICAKEGLGTAMAKEFRIIAGKNDLQIEVFSSIDQGRKWLDKD